MGSHLSRHICCVTCGTCKNREAEDANEESSETKPILQTSREPSIFVDRQPSPPALQVSNAGSEEVQDHRPPAGAAEERREPCSAADPTGMTTEWEAAWDSTDFSVAPAVGQTKGEVKVPAQLDNQRERERVGNAAEKIKPVPGASEAQPVTQTARDPSPDAEEEAGSEGSPCAGVTLQERNILNFLEITSETAAGRGCEIKPPAEVEEGPAGRNLPLCAVQVAEETETYLSAQRVEEMGMVKLPEISPRCSERAELTCLVETTSLLTAQDTQREAVEPLEVVANVLAETCSTSAAPWESLYPEGESLALADQLLDFLQQETRAGVPAARERESLHEVSRQSSDGVLSDLENKESRERAAETAAAEAEPQHGVTQQTRELPEEPLPCAQIPLKQEAEFPNVALPLPQALGSSGETEAENDEA